VEVARKTITQKSLGAKSIVVRPRAGGGTVIQEQNAAQYQALPDAQIIELATLGKRVADEFGVAQDIEWAWAGGKWFLLQARPITTL
jgi:pyruvate,water dikinase